MRKIDLLCTEQDREALRPIIEKLHAKGVRVRETQSPDKNGVILAVLSESFYADDDKVKTYVKQMADQLLQKVMESCRDLGIPMLFVSDSSQPLHIDDQLMGFQLEGFSNTASEIST